MCKGLTTDDVEVSRDTVIQEIRPGAGFETGDFVEEKLGGGGYRRTIWLRRHSLCAVHPTFLRALVPKQFVS